MPKTKIYLDNAATTPVDPRVLKAMLPYFSKEFGNASSLHQMGLDARVAVDRAQAKIAQFLRCKKEEVYFTSGATESDNLAIFGLVRALQQIHSGQKLHIITSPIEHDAVLEPCRELERQGVQVTYLPVNKNGLVELEKLKKAIRPNTVLISIMYVNNEVGTIQPIREVGALIKKINEDRGFQQPLRPSGAPPLKKGRILPRVYFHTDAVQAPSYCDCDVNRLSVDLLSLSAHKIYGPKGVGAIYIKEGTPLAPIIFGGHQQDNVRPGTYNVPLIVGLGKAGELILNQKTRKPENQRIKELRDYLIKAIKEKIPKTTVNGDLKNRTSNNANFIFKGAEGESIVLMLSQKGIAASTGSACSSGSLAPSHVLVAMGVKPELAHGSLRLTLGRFTTKKEIDAVVKTLPLIIAKLRKMSPLK